MAVKRFTASSRKLTNLDAFFHIVKATIGGGFLAMPEAFHNAGIVVGCIGITVLGLSVLNMMSFLVRCSQSLRSGKYAAVIMADRANRANGNDNPAMTADTTPMSDNNELQLAPMEYSETVYAVFRYGAGGRFAGWATFARTLTSTTLLITYYGINIIYVCIVAGTCKQLFDQFTNNMYLEAYALNKYPIFISIAVIPIGMISGMKSLVYVSKVANILISIGALIIFYFILGGDDRPTGNSSLIVWPVTRWSLFSGTTLCSLEGIGTLMKVENNMINPKGLAGPPSYTLHITMIIIIIGNALLGVMGYIKYGDDVKGIVSLNLPLGNCLAEAVKVMVALGILLSYGLQLNVTADLVWPWTRRTFSRFMPGTPASQNNAENTHNDDDTDIEKQPKALYFIMRLTLILVTIIVASIKPDIGPLISLVGSVGFSVLGLLVPVAMETVWYWIPKDDDNEDDVDRNSDQEDGLGFWDFIAPPQNIGMSVFWNVVGGVSLVTTNTRTSVSARNNASNTRAAKRIVRHVKNVIIVALAMFALIGGTWNSVKEIMATH